ncbi:hypothetical protein DFJ74DRAFT_103233 [Hyaloraphidium curvatum]|nr:hypothetical protein DFJ74DRAFT_103233 [Hyaloraphidium curvatum]
MEAAEEPAVLDVEAFTHFWTGVSIVTEDLDSGPSPALWAKCSNRIHAFCGHLVTPSPDASEQARRGEFVAWWLRFNSAMAARGPGGAPTIGEWRDVDGRISRFLKGKERAKDSPPASPERARPAMAVVTALVPEPRNAELADSIAGASPQTPAPESPATELTELAMLPAREESAPQTPVNPRKRPFVYSTGKSGYGTSSLKRFRWMESRERVSRHFVTDLMTDAMEGYGSLHHVDDSMEGTEGQPPRLIRLSARIKDRQERDEAQNSDPSSPKSGEESFISLRAANDTIDIPFGWAHVDLRDDDKQIVEVIDPRIWDDFGAPRDKSTRDALLELNEYYRNEAELERLRNRRRAWMEKSDEFKLAVEYQSVLTEIEERMDELRGKQNVLDFKREGPLLPKPLHDPRFDKLMPVTIAWNLPPSDKKKMAWEIVLARGLETDGKATGYISLDTIPASKIILRSPVVEEGKRENWLHNLRTLHQKVVVVPFDGFADVDSMPAALSQASWIARVRHFGRTLAAYWRTIDGIRAPLRARTRRRWIPYFRHGRPGRPTDGSRARRNA